MWCRLPIYPFISFPISVAFIIATFRLIKVNMNLMIVPPDYNLFKSLVYFTTLDLLTIFGCLAIIGTIVMSAFPTDTISVFFLLFNVTTLATSSILTISRAVFAYLTD